MNSDLPRWSWLLLVGALLVGPATSCGGARRDPALKAARDADLLWRARADPGGVEAALQAYLSVDEAHPDDQRVLWRLARMYTVMGYVEPNDALRHYATAREFGLRCLMLQPSFAGVVQSRGGKVVPLAASELTEEDMECLVWTVIAWSRWLEVRGSAGGGIDLGILQALGNQAAELGGGWGAGRAYYAKGLSHALPPAVLDPNWKAAREAFEASIDAAPDRLTPKVDYALLVLRRTGEEEAANKLLEEVVAYVIPDSDAEKFEDQRAQVRARAALGLPEPESAPQGPEDGAETDVDADAAGGDSP